MALARVVSFEGVSSERVAEMEREMNSEEPPEGVRATEMVVLHDPDAEKSVVVVFFEDEEKYRRGDEMLSNMDPGDTPGRRTSVGRYDVAMRMTR
jgi:hypothetical protein